MSSRTLLKSALALFLISLQILPSFAWVFPEHRDIVVLAAADLDSSHQAELQSLWTQASAGYENRLCPAPANAAQVSSPTCVDLSAFAALSGDHSCSAADMLNTALTAPWALPVERVAAHLKSQLATAAQEKDRRKQASIRTNAVRNSDLALERTDPEYATRAANNNAHFLLARPQISMSAEQYARMALAPTAEVNALGTYVWYHLRALDRAHSVAHSLVPAAQRAAAIRAALADEAFADHFLEDSFAAGHIAGNWGGTDLRKGTHDYYSQRGLALTTWNGDTFVGEGDAFMTTEDADRAAKAVSDSLAQLIDTFDGKVDLADADSTDYALPDAFDTCQGKQYPTAAGARGEIKLLVPIFRQTPVPALAAGPGELPRFRTELGTFVGLSTGVRADVLAHGFGPHQAGPSSAGGIELAARAGLGLDGILNDSSDGLIFVEFGVRDETHAVGAATIPGRAAITARLRMPFYAVPGDLLVATPILAFTNQHALAKMAIRAANGGAIPWQAGMATRIGRFQFVLGREVGVSLYRNGSDQFLLPTPGVPPSNTTTVKLNSVAFEFPVLEYRIFKNFSTNQSSGLTLQPYIGFDTPNSVTVLSPSGAPIPDAHTILTSGLRLTFDWRHYFK